MNLPIYVECELSKKLDRSTGSCYAECPYFKEAVTEIKRDSLLSPGIGGGYRIICGTNGKREMRSPKEFPRAIIGDLKELWDSSTGLLKKLIPQ